MSLLRASPGPLLLAALSGVALMLVSLATADAGRKVVLWDVGSVLLTPWPGRCSSPCSGAGST